MRAITDTTCRSVPNLSIQLFRLKSDQAFLFLCFALKQQSNVMFPFVKARYLAGLSGPNQLVKTYASKVKLKVFT